VIPDQSVLASAGPLAARTERLWWFSFWVAAGVYVLTMGFLVWSIARARRRARDGEPMAAGSDQRMTRAVSYGSGATVVILLLFLGFDLSVGRTLSPIPSKRPLTIEVAGHQWWWEATYADTSAHGRFTTANEVHIPVGEPVLFLLEARDVIHSIWVPNLAGKKDLVPGYTTSFWFQADTAGVYRGQCAEFCGTQHAKMAMFIVAEPRAKFDAWVANQREPAKTPTDESAQRGKEVFVTSSCAMCHSIEGTEAGSKVGPDLTHLASRSTIAAGTLPNTRSALSNWIRDAQASKPGVKMPPTALAPRDLAALLTYLEGLK
jgi:cytochrome c oxidase subunit 2